MPLPTLTKVFSSNLAEIGYDGHDLFVRFRNGQLWRYAGVEREKFEAMKTSTSVGTYFANEIRGRYPDSRV